MKRFILAAAFFAATPAFAAEPAASSAHPPGHQMEPAGDAGAIAIDHADHCGLPMGDGVITAIDVAKARATVNHKPIPAIGWDEMTMPFAVDKAVDLAAFAAGDRVHFLLAPEKKSKGQKIAAQNIVAMCSPDAEAGVQEACMASMHKAAMKIASVAGKPCAMDGMDHGAMEHGSKKKDGAAASGDHSQH
jgi:Cu/Ag efflux protein CusF